MKWIVVVFVACVCLFAYHAHRKSVEAAEAIARETALVEARREAAAQVERERAARLKEREAQHAAALRPLMAVSKVVEPLLIEVQAPLNIQHPADLVPIVELTKQRILDKRVHAEAERQPVFDRATALLDDLTRLAEERTSFLETMLRQRSTAGTMLNSPSTGSTSAFFAQNTAKRWDDTVARMRPSILQAMEQLRAAERQWNKQVDPDHQTETYDVVHFAPLLIPAEQVTQNSLSPGAKGGTSTTATRIWRRPYYDAYGYRIPNSQYYPNYPTFR
jgi:hypothetical protein